MALGGAVALLALMAGPASAEPDPPGLTSGGAVAVGGSVASGEAHAANGSTASGGSTAVNDSTASGDSLAVNGSVASGCATAINNSTASGDDCFDAAGDKVREKVQDGRDKDGDGRAPARTTAGGAGTGAGTARATTARLALTGSWSAPLAATAALAVVLGALLLASVSERRRAF